MRPIDIRKLTKRDTVNTDYRLTIDKDNNQCLTKQPDKSLSENELKALPVRDALVTDKRLTLDSANNFVMTNQPDNSAIGTAASKDVGTAQNQIETNALKDFKSFDSLTSAIAYVTANPDNIKRLDTASYRSSAECTTLGIDYPDGGGASYVVESLGTPDGYGDHAAGTKQLTLNPSGELQAKTFGAVFNGVAVDSPSLNAALQYAKTSGINVVSAPAGRALVQTSGVMVGFDYCILIPDGVRLQGAGYELSEIFMDNLQDAVVVTNDRSVVTSGESITGITVNGNADGQTTQVNDFGIWIRDSSDVHLDQIKTVNTGSFGYRLQTIDRLSFGTLRCDHAPLDPEETADGFHLIDCNDVAGDKVLVYTEGDDAFVIEANARDVENISIGEVVVTAPITSTAAGKGIYIVNNAANGSAGVQRELRNISIPNAVTHNCNGTGFILQRGTFKNININHTDYSSRIGAGFLVGDTVGVGVAGSVENSSFVLKSYNAAESGIESTIADGFIDNNIIDAQTYNPGDANTGITLDGTNWLGRVQVNYDPLSDKVSTAQACRLRTSDSEFSLTLRGGLSSLRVEGSNNTLHPISIKDFTVRDVEIIGGADNNTFIGGGVTTSVLDSGTGTTYNSVRGATNRKVESGTTEASGGLLRVLHGLIKAPTIYNANIVGNNTYDAQVQSVNSTQVILRVRDTIDNSPVNSTLVEVFWEASI